MSFFNANGHDCNVAGLDLDSFLSLEAADEERSMRTWVSVEELTSYDPFNEEGFDHMIDIREGDGDTDLFGIWDVELCIMGRADLVECWYWSFDVERVPVQYADIKEWYYTTMSDEEAKHLAAEAHAEAAAEQLECELTLSDNFMPSFSSNHDKRRLTYSEAEHKWYRANFWSGRNRSKKQAKFGIDGKRARKSSRDHRFGNRQEFAQLRDFWADRQDMWEDFFREESPSAVPTFDIKVVGLTVDEASYYEAEHKRERADYEHELEMAWFEPEPDYSLLFEPVTFTDQLEENWERQLFPERFEEYRPYRFSAYYDDWYDDFGYYDQFYEDTFEDERHGIELNLDDVDFGPSLEEWLEHDRLEIERMLETEADRFSPSFVGSTRSTLRYHISEPRRGKLKRKYGKSTSYFYRAGRPYTATAH